MDQVKCVRELLGDLLRGGHAHMNFDMVIADFPLDAINAKAPHVPYSAWHLLEHMRIAQWDILEFIRNPAHVSPRYPEGYRPRPDQQGREADWKWTIEAFLSDLEALQQLVADPRTDLFAPISHAPDYTILREILVVSDHNAYHLGEIAILRQVMNLWPLDAQYLTGTPE